MGWLGSWAYRIPIKYGTSRPTNPLSAYPLLIEFDHARIRSEYSLGGGGRPSMAVTQSDGTTTAAFGVIQFSAGGAGASMAAGTATASNDTITITSHGLQAGWTVYWQANAPSGLAINTQYYVISPTTNTFKVSDTSGGAAKDITADGSFLSGDLQLQTSAITLRAQFNISSSASTGDVLGYLYVDHSQTDQENKSGVLDSNTQIYSPLEDSPTGSANDIKDWTSNAYHGTSNGAISSGTGEVANDLTSFGNGKCVNYGNPTGLQFSTSSSFTVSAWINKASNGGGTYGSVFTKQGSTSGKLGYTLHVTSGGKIEFELDNTNVAGSNCVGATTLSNSTWYHVAGTFDGTTQRVYLNGTQDQSAICSVTAAASDSSAYLGNDSAATTLRFFDGSIDELRVASAARSADWIAYEHTNEGSNSSTVTAGTEETLAADTLLGQICL